MNTLRSNFEHKVNENKIIRNKTLKEVTDL